ncbi:MAG TPA: class II aldolase/adducin family protein [Terriglobia bacterium]|nr:class II aldolase/adducin family protein [Terriglobia bacterium]
MIKTEDELRREIVEVGRWVHRQGYVAGYDGNISVRLDNRRILSTPTTIGKGMMQPDDLVVVDYEGHKIAGQRKVTSEIAMHLLIYKRRPDVHAVVHAHPPTATGFAAAGLSLNKALISEVVLSFGCIPLARYGTPGTPELTEALMPLVGSYDAILMANHGVVTYAPDLARAYFKMETVEHFAKISLVTEILGRQVLLSRTEVDKLLAARQSYFGPGTPAIERSAVCPIADGTHVAGGEAGSEAGCGADGEERFAVSKEDLAAMVREALTEQFKSS